MRNSVAELDLRDENRVPCVTIKEAHHDSAVTTLAARVWQQTAL
jgi:hypothetical protein